MTLDTLQTRDKVNEIEPDINVVLWKNERQGDDEKLLFLEDWDHFLQDLEKQYR